MELVINKNILVTSHCNRSEMYFVLFCFDELRYTTDCGFFSFSCSELLVEWNGMDWDFCNIWAIVSGIAWSGFIVLCFICSMDNHLTLKELFQRVPFLLVTRKSHCKNCHQKSHQTPEKWLLAAGDGWWLELLVTVEGAVRNWEGM